MSVVIPRNTSIPVKKTRGYVTTIDNQSSVEIDVYEGERMRASDNTLLGLFSLNVPLALRGLPIKVCFAIDDDGILNVSAWEETSGNTKYITITNEKGRLSAEEIERMIREAETFRAEDLKFKKKAQAMNALDDYLYKMTRKVMKDSSVTSKLTSVDKMKIHAAMIKGKKLVDGDLHEETSVFVEVLSELESFFDSVLGKVNKG